MQEQMNRLPKALQEVILDYTFSAGPGIQYITPEYKPPSALQVSQATREKFAEPYYSRTRFRAISTKLLNRWLWTLSEPHYRQIQTIEADWSLLGNAAPETASLPGERAEDTIQRNFKRSCSGKPGFRRNGTDIWFSWRYDYRGETLTTAGKQLWKQWKSWKMRKVLRLLRDWALETGVSLPVAARLAMRYHNPGNDRV